MRHSRKILSVLLALVLALSMIPAALAAEGETPATEGETHITILCTSDMHGDIWGYDYASNKETDRQQRHGPPVHLRPAGAL